MKVITDFENMDFSEVISLICEKCNLTDDLVVCKVEIRTWHEADYFDITERDGLYEFLNELIQVHDCKNGCELREENSEYYFTIVGSNRYNKKQTSLSQLMS